ncbi:MAG TPA: MBL fold metallo-hydrolase [Chitinophagaceae bacterium]|nr:MBL fold metallo-hydrolase [Chitinophagaceae bacterium]
MKIKLRGVRGSIPTTGPDTEHYGANTSCTEVDEEGWMLVLDGGSGMRQSNTGQSPSNKRIDILLTHLHLDHIQGLGFFKPLFDPQMEIHIWGPASSTQSLHTRLSLYLSPPLFPVHIRDLPCKHTLHEIDNCVFEIGPFTIQSGYIIHPGPTLGFRIKGQHSVFTYMPDHEPALGRSGILKDRKWVSGIDLAAGADLLLHDAQYSLQEYKTKIGWGHSAMEDTLLFSSLAEVKHLLMAHHDPSHSDEQLDQLFTDLKRTNDYSSPYELAAEGMEIELP